VIFYNLMSVKLLLPALSPTMEEGQIIKWFKSIGDKIEVGDVICEVETDKATMDVEATDEGMLACILVGQFAPTVAKVNAVIAILAEFGENIADIQASQSTPENIQNGTNVILNETPIIEQTDSKDYTIQAPLQEQTQVVNNSERLKISPLARVILKENKIDKKNFYQIPPSGPNNRIIKRDVNKFLSTFNTQNIDNSSTRTVAHVSDDLSKGNISNLHAEHVQSSKQQVTQAKWFDMSAGSEIYAPDSDYEKYEIQNSNADDPYYLIKTHKVREIISGAVMHAFAVPSFTMYQDCIVDKILEIIPKMQEESGIRISINDFVIKACGFAGRKVRHFRMRWNGPSIRIDKNVDVSMAIGLHDAIIKKTIYDVEAKSLSAISLESKNLAKQAQTENLDNMVFSRSTLVISNIGKTGIPMFVPSNASSATLGVSSARKMPVVENDQIVIRSVMNVSLVSDHRIVDGMHAAAWLRYFKLAIENPAMMLL
jgi:pyruvate dehydrogenase E2 component (dihydrolipoamide acetyltransferase)